jgi:hypothetical protein
MEYQSEKSKTISAQRKRGRRTRQFSHHGFAAYQMIVLIDLFEIFDREKQSATMGTRDENNKREDRATRRAIQLPDVPKNRHVLDRDDKAH